MTIEFLKNKISEIPSLLYWHELDSEFQHVRMLGADNASANAQYLYIGTAEDFQREGIPPKVRNIICIGTEEALHAVPGYDRCNVLLVPPETSLPVIFNHALQVMDNTERFAKCSDLLLHSSALLHGESFSLDHVMDVIYELLENPISICDTDGTLLCYKHIDDLATDHKHFVTKGEPLSSISDNFKNISALVDFDADPVVLDSIDGLSIKNVVSKITADGATIAYFVLIELNRKIIEPDIAILKLVCNWLSTTLRRNSIFLTPQKVMVSHFLSDLLSDSFSSQEEVYARARDLNIAKKPLHTIVMIDIQDLDFAQQSPSMIREILKTNIPGALSIIYNDRIVFYLNYENSQYLDGENRKRIRELLKTYHLRLGISLPYQDLSKTKAAFEQAQAAVRLGQRFDPQNHVLYYQDYALYHLLEHHQMRSGTDLMDFCDPELLMLMEHDKENNTPYVYTTYILLTCGGKQTDAASILHIHRSTMLYRIERITELTGWDFRSMATLTNLRISYSILVLNGKLDADTYRF